MASSIDASTSGAGGVITTADNTGILQLKTAGTTAVTIDASQNVGIGTTSPYSRLNLSGSSANYNNSASVTFNDTSGDSGARKWLVGNVTPVNYGSLVFAVSSTPTGDPTNTKMLIDSSGNVGIGTTNPSYKLQVYGASNPEMRLGDATVTYQLYTEGSTAAVMGTVGSHALVYRTNATERMRIDSSGRLLLAGTSAIAGYQFTMYHTDTGGMAYKYNGTSEQNSCSFQNANGQVGRIYTSNSNTTYSTSSDYRLKENVVPMTGALDKVAQLNPVTFTWKTDGTDGQGFIAHELQAVVPDCVGGTKDAVDADGNPVYQDIDTSFLVATLTAAIKEQQTIINDLKARVTALEAK